MDTRKVKIMPYLTDTDKMKLDEKPLEQWSAGDINYAVTNRAIARLMTMEVNYNNLQSVFHMIPKFAKEFADMIDCDCSEYDFYLRRFMGAADLARLEFYRRLIAPYEDMKIKENGDVYPRTLLHKVGAIHDYE